MVGERASDWDDRHEVLLSPEEAARSRRDGRYVVVAPMLPELAGGDERTGPSALKAEYSSADGVVDLHETIAILNGNRLLPGQQSGGHDRLGGVSTELLR